MSQKPLTPLLDTISSPADLRQLEDSQLQQLTDELRDELIDSVSTKKEITCPECQQKSLINDVNEMPKNLALLNNHNPYISGTQDISLRSTIKNTDQVALEKIFRQNVDKSIESLSNRDEDIQKNENSCSQSRI